MKDMGRLPKEMLNELRPTLDLLQAYGLTQEVVQGLNNAAAAEGANVAFGLGSGTWAVLYDASVTVIKTGTVTALRASISIRLRNDPSQEFALASESLGPFGATETGAASVVWTAPYPRLIPPDSLILGRCDIIGTDATANMTVGAHFGILG